MIYNRYVRKNVPAWEKLRAAYDDRKGRKQEFPGFTTAVMAAYVSDATKDDRERAVVASTIRKMMTAPGTGLTNPRKRALEELLLLPPGWLSDGAAPEVPAPTGIHSSTYSGDPSKLSPTSVRVTVYRGGTADMWHMTKDQSEDIEVLLRPGEEDDTFVRIVNGSLIPAAFPTEILSFRAHKDHTIRRMLLIRNNADSSLCSIRRYDPETDTFIDPKGRHEPLSPKDWDVIGLGMHRYAPEGLEF